MFLLIYIVACIVFISGIIFLKKYNKVLRDPGSDLHKFWITDYPNFYVYMKIIIPVLIFGFALIILNSILAILVIFTKTA